MPLISPLMPVPLTLPYLTLPFGAGVLPPSAEASSGPNAHPRINPKVIETFCRFLQTGGGCSSVPVLGHLFLRNAFQRIHIVSQRFLSNPVNKQTDRQTVVEK